MALSRKMLLRTSAAIIGLDGVEDRSVAERLGTYRDVLMAGTSVERRIGGHAAVLQRAAETKQRFADEFVMPPLRRRADIVDRWRAGALARDQLPIDLLTLLVVHGEHERDPDRVVRECILYLAASTNTTSMVITDTVAELSDWARTHPDDAELVHDQKFLRSAVDEALRLHPPAEVLRRRATGRVKLRNGMVLDSEQLVAARLSSANRDSTIFGAAADSFNPRRVVPDGMARYGLAFGAGAHMCIGRPLVLPSVSTAEEPLQGAIVQILLALYAACMEVDPKGRREYMPTYYPHVSKLPIRFAQGRRDEPEQEPYLSKANRLPGWTPRSHVPVRMNY
jgi:cytochrome P450